ncbi:MAG TPA: hypothetical protein VFL57_12140 [Bryobacteraceae bacterium]|nr:hypothetical protein [Bryobacteraceae bacterium]
MRSFPFAGSPAPNAGEVLLDRGSFRIRCADTHGERSKSSLLIERMYSWRGYKHEAATGYEPDLNQITLQAFGGDQVFGTLSLSLDSEAGLAADELYHEEIEAYRNAGATVCELTRLAIDPQYGSKEVLGALFHLAYIYGSVLRRVSDVFIEVNPRHVSFYNRMLDFHEAGELKMCPRVDAPAVLLHLEVAHVRRQILRYGGQREESRRSLYPYFFSKKEEEGLCRRLLGNTAHAYA